MWALNNRRVWLIITIRPAIGENVAVVIYPSFFSAVPSNRSMS